MPSTPAILSHLTAVSNDAVAIAIAWHVVVAVAILALVFGWRPSRRVAGMLLAAPIASAATVAFVFGNPFNGTMLGVLTLALVGLAARFRSDPVHSGSPWMAVAGTCMIAFGLFYPHFLTTRSVLTYLYAAPTGLIPCPTLAMVIGFALVAGGLGTRTWSLALGGFGLFYGVFGTMRLHVLLDVGLVFGVVALTLGVLLKSPSRRVPQEPAGVRQVQAPGNATR